MITRQRLPNRRAHEVIPFTFSGIRFTAGIGRFEDGRTAEIFIDSNKAGSAVEASARSAAIIASIALQHGIPLQTIHHALQLDERGQATSAIGAIVAILLREPEPTKEICP
jgi:ribonucleoside-diphosphate reductase alpha chain